VQHNQQGEPDRVGEQRLLLGTDLVEWAHDRIGHVHADRLLATRFPGLQHVEADARDHGGEPAAEVLDRARIRAASSNGATHPASGANLRCGRQPTGEQAAKNAVARV
jgi:hypothetical protein